MAKRYSQPGQIHLQIIEVMKRFPSGVSAGQIRQELEKEGLKPEDLTDLDRPIQELDNWFMIEVVLRAENAGVRTPHAAAGTCVGERLRFEVLLSARGCCQCCGRSIQAHGISLIVRPRERNACSCLEDRDDFWAVCENCYARENPHPRYGARRASAHRPKHCRRCTSSDPNPSAPR